MATINSESFTSTVSSLRGDLNNIFGRMDELGIAMNLKNNKFNPETFSYEEVPDMDFVDDDTFDKITSDIMEQLLQLGDRITAAEILYGITEEC